MMEKQDVTLTCITPDDMPDVRTFRCFVFGAWAVHRPHPNDDPIYWHISHIPTGACGFVTERYTEALRAARRLATIGQPPVKVVTACDGRLRLTKLPRRWQDESLKLVSDLDVWVVSGGRLVHPYQLLRERAQP